MSGIIDYLIKFSLIRSSIYISIAIIIMIVFNLDFNTLKNPFIVNSISAFASENVIQNDINILYDSFIKSYTNSYIYYPILLGLFYINFKVLVNIIIYYKEINMPYALNYFNPIKKFEWQEKTIKVSHDRFISFSHNSLFYKNSIAIDIDKYENTKNEIIQYLNLPNNFEIQIKTFNRKGVEIKFYILPTKYTINEDTYKKGYINYGMSSEGLHNIKITDITHTIIVGESGSGKSNFIHHLLQSLIISQDFIKSLELIDLKGTELYPYRNRNNMNFIDEIEPLKETLLAIKDVMKTRFQEMKQNGEQLYSGKYIFILVDEFGSINTSPDKKLKDSINNSLIEIAQKGRAAKIILLLFGQKIDSTNLNSNVLANMQSSILFRTDNDFNVQNTIGKKEDIEKITRFDVDSFPRGRCMIKDGISSSKKLIQVPLITI